MTWEHQVSSKKSVLSSLTSPWEPTNYIYLMHQLPGIAQIRCLRKCMSIIHRGLCRIPTTFSFLFSLKKEKKFNLLSHSDDGSQPAFLLLKSLRREKSSSSVEVFRESFEWALGSWNISRGEKLQGGSV